MSIRRMSIWLLCGLVVGCSRGPKPVDRPNINPAKMASDAIAQLDADGSGGIDAKEANAAPGLAAGFKRADANKDGTLTSNEIAERIETIVSISPAIVNLVVELTSQGRPVEGALVTVVADEFLGDQFPNGSAATDEFGIAAITDGERGFAL